MELNEIIISQEHFGLIKMYPMTPQEKNPCFFFLAQILSAPTEVALMLPHIMEPADVSDYQEELILFLSTACKMAANSICKAQAKYKKSYDKNSELKD